MEDVHAEFVCETCTLVERGMLVVVVEVVESSELLV